MPKKPVQVYLDTRDRALLDRLARREGLTRAEAIREAVRRWASDTAGADDRLLQLIGSIDNPALPADLSTRHDAYAVAAYAARRVADAPEPPEPPERSD